VVVETEDGTQIACDVAEVGANDSGCGTLEILWNSAMNQGRIAGLNMAAEPVHRHTDGVALDVTRIAGRKCMLIGTVGSGADADPKGPARGDSDIWRQLWDASVVEFECSRTHV